MELAGEIAVDFPDKKLTLVHKGPRLLEFIGAKAADKTLKWLKSKNVEVRLEQSVDVNTVTDGHYRTSAGDTIKADCHFLCIGKPLASAWLKETVLKNDLDAQGRIKVDENLKVKGRNNIFAIGDITDIPVSAGLLVIYSVSSLLYNFTCSHPLHNTLRKFLSLVFFP